MTPWVHLILFFVSAHLMSGCAILYYDTKTRTQHVVGFGHMKMRIDPPRENLRAGIFGLDTVGLTIGSSPGGKHVSLGWQSLRTVEIMDNSAVRLEWITNDPFTIRVGTEFPYLLEP